MNEVHSQPRILVESSRLSGQVALSGAKNSALKLVAASLLTDETIHLEGFPSGLVDIQVMLDMLRRLGKVVEAAPGHASLGGPCTETALDPADRSVRTSLLVLAALVARYGHGAVPLPGGCRIGERKYDLHQLVLESLGARVRATDDLLIAEADDRLRGAEIQLPLRSTGATESCLLAGALARGTTTLWGPHIRPEILDLIELLERMGARIRVFGQERIEIEGVDALHGARHQVLVDNMEAFTFLVAAAATEGDVEILRFPARHLEVPLIFARASGVRLHEGEDSVIVRGGRTYPVELSTGPYPGINSDMQPLFAVLALRSPGESRITDLRFPDRFGYAEELARLGGSFDTQGNVLRIRGGGPLRGSTVRALDLRCGAALLVAGLMAEGTTCILDPHQIDRGYEDIAGKMQLLGARVRRENYEWPGDTAAELGTRSATGRPR
jgi:UDP-N-acetylglucosamine 1-carboxyvinyltransferase